MDYRRLLTGAAGCERMTPNARPRFSSAVLPFSNGYLFNVKPYAFCSLRFAQNNLITNYFRRICIKSSFSLKFFG